jgi:hypothetical protein
MINKASRKTAKFNKLKDVANTADKTSDTLQYVESRPQVEDKPDWATGGMKRGGRVKSASSRADGIAQRGKTRGKMR